MPSVDVMTLLVPPFDTAANIPNVGDHAIDLYAFVLGEVLVVQEVPLVEVMIVPLSPTAANNPNVGDHATPHMACETPVEEFDQVVPLDDVTTTLDVAVLDT